VSVTPGFIRYELRSGIERPTRYLLLIQWETLEAHTVTFRQSENFTHHRALISPYFAQAPLVEHFSLCHPDRP
jgi:heme-degrading monooxygenase HmoA